MKLGEYLHSGLLPRIKKKPDIFSQEYYLALPFSVKIYGDDGREIVDDLTKMDAVKYETVRKYFDDEVFQVQLSVDSDVAFLSIIIAIPCVSK